MIALASPRADEPIELDEPLTGDTIDALLWLTSVLPRRHRRKSPAVRFFVVFRVTPR